MKVYLPFPENLTLQGKQIMKYDSNCITYIDKSIQDSHFME